MAVLVTGAGECAGRGRLRVERARVLGPVVVLPGAEPFAAAIRARYGVPVLVQTQHELRRALGPVPDADGG